MPHDKSGFGISPNWECVRCELPSLRRAKVALSLRDRLAERANDVDWLLWVDRADDVK